MSHKVVVAEGSDRNRHCHGSCHHDRHGLEHPHGHHCHGHHHVRKLVKLAALGVAVAAIAEELRKPQDQREWHGKVGGVVPYDFRVPTAERVTEALWNPEGPVIGSHIFGVGWCPNIGRIVTEAKKSIS